ncbi:GNAT family N-acetyltransferase [Oceaniglobus trochenteri]|uniref:GNAT family N-acetyltransferase n=1 Tax=Oceaniglobus trochenteri TaxID=2763260 RepID=UPI001CFFB930|nr:GNAT family N-acetyltransferase [Oceaniglobus trochenteri]
MQHTTIEIPTLRTERLILRAPKASDLPDYTAFRMSDRTAFLGGPFTEAQAFDQLGEIIGHWHLRGMGRWIVADGETDAPLGIVGFFFPVFWPEPELAWSVFEAGEGRGVAYEAALAARAFAYDSLGLTTLISCVDPLNTRSVALAKRMGGWPEGSFEHPDKGTIHVWRHPGPEAS